MNSLLRKEIRDAVRWLPLGIALLGLLSVYACQLTHAPSLSSQLYMVTWFSALLYGSFLSIVTFLPDERDAARAFLIHRAISTHEIFRTRVLAGLIVYGLGLFIPLAVLAIYLGTVGPQRSPVSPWQVLPAFLAVVAGSIFYFAGIVIACRPAKWFGTRLLPLVAAVGGSFMSISLLAGAPLYLTLPVYALSCAAALCMAFAARHAFVRMPSQVVPARVRAKSLSMRFILLSSSILIVSATGLLPINLVNPSSYRYPTTDFDKDGMPIYIVRDSAFYRGDANEFLESIPMIAPSEPRPERIEIGEFGTPFILNALANPANRFDPTYVNSMGDRQVYFDPTGYLFVYQMNRVYGSMLECVIASDSISLPNEPRGTPFKKIPRILMAAPFYPEANARLEIPPSKTPTFQSANELAFVTSDGIFKANVEKRTVEVLLKESIDSIGLATTGGMERIAIQSGDALHVYKSDASHPSRQLTQFTLESTLKTAAKTNGFLCYRDSDNWTLLDGLATQRTLQVARCTAGKTREYEFTVPEETRRSLGRVRHEYQIVLGALPPLLTIGSLAITQTFSELNAIDFFPLLLQCLVTIALTITATRRRCLGARQTAIWIALGLLLGPGVSLAVIAIYPVAFYERCGACNRRRRVENETCEHCGASWDPMPVEGIELVESEPTPTLSAVG